MGTSPNGEGVDEEGRLEGIGLLSKVDGEEGGLGGVEVKIELKSDWTLDVGAEGG